MNFNSLDYFLLLAATLAAFYGARGQARILVLAAASVVFYGSWSLPFVSLIFVSAIVDFVAGREIGKSEESHRRKAFLLLSLTTNLGLLGYFKYANFFAENVLAAFGRDATTDILNVVLPPGISFYTFQTLSYTIDVYKKRIAPATSFSRFFLYVAFFPQLVAGPIERASHLLPQFDRSATHRWSTEDAIIGARLIVFGMFKKVLIADPLARLVEPVYASPLLFDGWSALIATYAFTLQIYCDFSAYSEIARGSARMFGIHLMRNFDQPYLTTDMTDFWRRWHISLSTWIRDYLYLPLGGSRRGRVRTLVNVTITMFLSGLWHGAAWNFVLWGLFHGALLVLTHGFRHWRSLARDPDWSSPLKDAAGWWLTFHFVVVGWILFRVDSIGDFPLILEKIAMTIGSMTLPTWAQLVFLAGLTAFLAISWLERRHKLLARIDDDTTRSAIFYGTLIVIMLLFAERDGPQFLYFQF